MYENEIDVIIRQHLDDFYWEHVAPLEQQIIELGHKPKVSRPQGKSFRPDRSGKMWLEHKDKREQFFVGLMYELWDAGFLIRPENSDWRLKEKMNPRTLDFAYCFDWSVGFIEGTMDVQTWQNNKKGDLELCVYMIDELIRLKIISDTKKDVWIEKVFAVKDATRKRQKFSTYHNTDYKPKRHKEIDDAILRALDKCGIQYTDLY